MTSEFVDSENQIDNSSLLDSLLDGNDQIGGDAVGTSDEVNKSSKRMQYFGAVFNLANTALGAGILAMPYAFEQAGLAMGLLIILVVVTLCALSQEIVILGMHECQEKESRGAKRVDSYDLMVRSLLGPVWGTTMEILIAVYQFGACVAYVLVFQDQLEPLLKCGLCGGDCCEIRPVDKSATCSCDSFWCKRTIVILLGTWVLMFPPSIMHSISKLKFVSLLGVMCPFIMASIIVYFGIDEMVEDGLEANFDNVQWFTNTPKGVFVAIPIFCFALQSHISVPVIFNGYPKVQKKSNFRFVIIMAYIIVTSLYIPTGLFGLTYFLEKSPDNFPKDLLTGFKTNEILANVARVCMAGAAVCCYPLNHFPGRCAIFNIYKTFTGKDVEKMDPGVKDIYYLIEVVIFTGLATGLAIAVPNVATVFGVLGATVASSSMFIFPGLIMYHFAVTYKFTIGSPSLSGASPSMSPLVRQQSWLKPPRECNKSVVIGVFYAAFGLVIAVIGTYVSI